MTLTKMSPFVKWAGGKKQLLQVLHKKLPQQYNTYYEPFIGGGALFFNEAPQFAVIADVNEQLINVYLQLQKNPQAVIDAVNNIDGVKVCDKNYYLIVRERYNQKIVNHELDAECAGLMIWINKHCFNGLYRVNSKGLFNVPFNNKTEGKSISETNLISIGKYLKDSRVSIVCQDFAAACNSVKAGDFVYFDSPYVPVSKTAAFTDYTKSGFTYDNHVRLAELYKKLDNAGVKIMLSNSNVDLVHKLYKEFNIETVNVRRSINSNAGKRVGKEVIVTNY